MKDLVTGNLIMDIKNMDISINGGEPRTSPVYFRKVIKNDFNNKIIEVENSQGAKFEGNWSEFNETIKIPEDLLLHLGFEKFQDETRVNNTVYFNSCSNFRLEKMRNKSYKAFSLNGNSKSIICFYELQNIYKEFTNKDLDISDFNNWQFNFNI